MNNEYDHYYQEQQPSQPSYNNNYGYSDNKKISFNNSYDKDNSKYSKYSKFPTIDKKYVCQRGQFGGLVESVEFCKLKIAQGSQGRSVARQNNRTNLYLTLGNIVPSGEIPLQIAIELTSYLNVDIRRDLLLLNPIYNRSSFICFTFYISSTVNK